MAEQGNPNATGATSTRWNFSPDGEAKFQQMVERYPTRLSALMPTLWLCQEEFGWLKGGVPEYVAERLDLPVARVYEVITFYTMYFLENPGEYNLQVCRNISCHMMGAQKIIGHISEKLGISHGERTEDGKFRLEEVECLGACGMAPMMQVGKVFHENLTTEKVDALLEEFKRNG